MGEPPTDICGPSLSYGCVWLCYYCGSSLACWAARQGKSGVHDVSNPLELEMTNQDTQCSFLSGVIYSRRL